ncbi:MAG: hypothetical protein ACR65U_08035 [Methylocystis sp.]
MAKRPNPYVPFIASMAAKREAGWRTRVNAEPAEKITVLGWKEVVAGTKALWRLSWTELVVKGMAFFFWTLPKFLWNSLPTILLGLSSGVGIIVLVFLVCRQLSP